MKVWFTSDTHFGHEAIIKYDKRPFSSVSEMEDGIVDNWNECVSPGDLVYHLGDFSFTNSVSEIERVLFRLNGTIHLIFGNHDKRVIKKAKGFSWQGHYKEIKINDDRIVLFHYPIVSWRNMHKGACHLHGHCHGNLNYDGGMMMDVGVTCNDYKPVSYEQVVEYMTGKMFKGVDHHDNT